MDYEKTNKEAVELAQAIVKLTSAGWTCIAPGFEKKELNLTDDGCCARGTVVPAYKLRVKPEWSEEDKEILDSLITDVECCEIDGHIGGPEADRKIAWLKSIQSRLKRKAKMPMWRKIKAGEHLPCDAYLWRLAYEDEKNFANKCHIDGLLIPNVACEVGCDTWYLSVADIKNLPKEE